MEAASKETKRVSQLQEAFETKYCNGCELDLPVDSFSVDNSRKDGRNIRCRSCVVKRWREKNLTKPCSGCGVPSMNGTCSHCYRFDGLIFKLEEEIYLTIPRLLYNAKIVANRAKRAAIQRRKEMRAFVNSLAQQKQLTPHARLAMLLSRVTNGTPGTDKTKNQSA